MIYKQFGHDQSGVHKHIILILDHTYMHMQTIGKSLKELKDHEGNVEELCYTFQVCQPWIILSIQVSLCSVIQKSSH